MSIMTAIGSTIAMRVNFSEESSFEEGNKYIRGFFAITTGLLWLKVLGLAKSINMQLATFVLAIVQIFYTLMVPDYCTLDESSKQPLNCSQLEYYLKVYSILLGDFGEFERDDFATVFSVMLFVFFSFMVVIVLLNVLIAIISDSYEKCLVNSKSLFGRARVMLLAELVSFQNLLRKKNDHVNQSGGRVSVVMKCQNKWTRETFIFFYLSVTVVVLWIMGETVGYLSGKFHGDIQFSIASIFANVGLILVVMTVLSSAARITDSPGVTKQGILDSGISKYCSKYITNFVQKIMMRFLGMTEENSLKNPDMEEWQGRVLYLQREMARVTKESTAKVKADVKALDHDMRSAMEIRIAESEAAIMAELKASEKRIEEMMNNNMKYIASIIQEANQKQA
eukprot:15348769-Ditylum_brightwellii.AAC.1